LVQLQFDSGRLPQQPAILEEISHDRAAAAVENPCPVGISLVLQAGDFSIPAQVLFRLPRETDFLLELQFAPGFRWDPSQWKPDHLFLPPRNEGGT
jgi:hypothetical protein